MTTTEQHYNEISKLQLENLNKIISGELKEIFVLVNQGSESSKIISHIYEKDNAFAKPIVRKYVLNQRQMEFRSRVFKKLNTYHRITLTDLIRGTDLYDKKITWFDDEEAAKLFVSLI